MTGDACRLFERVGVLAGEVLGPQRGAGWCGGGLVTVINCSRGLDLSFGPNFAAEFKIETLEGERIAA